MSDELTSFDGMEPDSGSTEYEYDNTEAPDTPILSMDEYSNYSVPIKLDGEELQVPLSEAIAGYQRQADYTRKTQELSQQREQVQFAASLASALEADPAKTLDLLSSHYGISRQAAAQMVEQEPEYLDPIEQKYRELDKRIGQFEEYQNKQAVEREILDLQSKYGDFDPREVVTLALAKGTTDLEGTYKQLAFDKMMAQRELDGLAQQRQAQIEESVMQSKRLASVVNGGSSATGSTTTERIEPVKTIAEAWAAAKRQMGAD